MVDSFAQHIRSAKTDLTAAKRLLQDEITQYPGPIAGCDAQFNHLLAERQRVLSALKTLDEAVFVPTPRSPTPQSGVESR